MWTKNCLRLSVGLAILATALSLTPVWAATELLKNVDPRIIPRSSDPRIFGRIGSYVYFRVTDTVANRHAIWRTDGTPDGTIEMRELDRLVNYSDVLAVNGRLIMSAFENGAHRLWSTDGTGAGTVAIGPSTIRSGPTLLGMLADGRAVFILVEDNATATMSMWVSDGTPAGTIRFQSPSNFAGVRSPNSWAAGNVIYYYGGDDTTGIELWRTDGTAAGTRIVRDIEPGSASSDLDFIERAGDYLYFRANTSLYGTEPWRVNVITGVAELFADFAPGVDNSFIAGLLPLSGNRFVFSLGAELWVSNGTQGNATLLRDFTTATYTQMPFLTTINGRVLFVAETSSTGFELWTTDGSSAGTTVLRDHAPGPGNTSINLVGRLDAAWVLSLIAVNQAEEFWRTDGTLTGTVRLTPSTSAVIGSGALAFTESNGTRLWRVDRATGASQVGDLTHALELYVDSLRVGDRIIVRGTTPTEGTEPWVTDGTVSGTRMLRDIVPQSQNDSAGVQQLTTLGGAAYFVARTEATGPELWKSDGTANGTNLLHDIAPGQPGSGISRLTAIGNRLYFVANDGTHGYELWTSDGTAMGTRMVKDIALNDSSMEPASSIDRCQGWIASANGVVYFVTSGGGTRGTQLWKTDGTEAGTSRVIDLRASRSLTHSICIFLSHNGLVYFSLGETATGIELYRTDGTASGTILLKDINPGTNSSEPSQLTVYRNHVYFIAQRTQTSQLIELWRTDGSANGTEQIHGAGVRISSTSEGATQIMGVLNDRLIAVFGGGTQATLVSTDATSAGTSNLSNSIVGLGPGVRSGPFLYFQCGDLCVTDGTASGTLKVKNSSPISTANSAAYNMLDLNGTLYFQSYLDPRDAGVWKSNGSVASTVRAGPARQTSYDTMAIAGGRVLFSGFDDENGTELWRVTSVEPRAVDDTASATAGSPISLTLSSNDSDADSQLNTRSVRITAAASNGTTTVNADGTVRYTANSGFSGTDTFKYRVSDEFGVESNEATVTVAITAPPPPPSTSGGGGGGGGGLLEWWCLLILAGLSTLRPRRRYLLNTALRFFRWRKRRSALELRATCFENSGW